MWATLALERSASRLARAGARRQRARPRGRGLGRRTRRDAAAASTPGSTSRPTTASSSPERSPATAGGTATDVRGDRPGRSPSSGTTPHRPAAVAAVPWQPRRPPPQRQTPPARYAPDDPPPTRHRARARVPPGTGSPSAGQGLAGAGHRVSSGLTSLRAFPAESDTIYDRQRRSSRAVARRSTAGAGTVPCDRCRGIRSRSTS